VLGFTRGGIVGGILGDLGGEFAGKLLTDPELRTLVSRSILKKAGQKLPKEEILNQLRKEIADFAAKQAELPQLPPPSAIYQGPTQGGKPFTPNPQFGTTPVVETKTVGKKGLLKK